MAIVVLVLIWVYVIQPFIVWVQNNALLVGGSTVVLLAITATGYGLYRKQSAREAEERRARELQLQEGKRRFEDEQKAKGLFMFVAKNGVQQWGTPDQVAAWKKKEEEESLPYRVAQSIRQFEP